MPVAYRQLLHSPHTHDEVGVVLVLVPWVALVLFVVAVVARIVRILSLPVHLRWELYPVAHEPNASYGGSFFEKLNWWEHKRSHGLFGVLRVMVPEILLLEAVREHNPSLWRRSFPFHFGLYCGAAFLALLVAGAVLAHAGIPVSAEAQGLGMVVHWLTAIVGVAGLALSFLGALALLVRRLSDPTLKNFSTVADFFNLGFFLVVSGLGLVTVALVDQDLSGARAIAEGALTFTPVAGVSPLSAALVIMTAVLFAYIPATHMSHFFTKWFMYHDIRWDDAVNEAGSRLEKRITRQLSYPVDWSAPHIRGDGKKTWVDVATEDVGGQKQ
jgi:nitrate reductase gamma subunit